MAVNRIAIVDLVVDSVVVGTQNHALVPAFGDILVDTLENLPNQKPNSSVARRTSITTGGLSR